MTVRRNSREQHSKPSKYILFKFEKPGETVGLQNKATENMNFGCLDEHYK